MQVQRGNRSGVKILLLIPLTLVIDQVSKYIIQHTMQLGQSEAVLGEDFFRLTYIHNPGAAFGLNMGSPLLHTIVSIAALGVLVWLFWTLPHQEHLLRLALVLVLGGALGNIVDRLYLGEVVDFFDFGFGSTRWPIFNFADSFVTIGVGLMALGYARQKRQHSAPTPTEPPQDV